MYYCKNCGQLLHEDEMICSQCGVKRKQEIAGFIIAILSVLFAVPCFWFFEDSRNFTLGIIIVMVVSVAGIIVCLKERRTDSDRKNPFAIAGIIILILNLIFNGYILLTSDSYKVTYDLYEDHVEISGYEEELPKNVSLPSKIQGHPVTAIEDSAFAECSDITSVTLSENVTVIGKCAFYACPNLQKITIKNPNCNIYDAETTISKDADNSSKSIKICGYSGSTAHLRQNIIWPF